MHVWCLFPLNAEQLRYLEAVLDVVARLPDAHSLQHTCVPQLPQHQVIIKP